MRLVRLLIFYSAFAGIACFKAQEINVIGIVNHIDAASNDSVGNITIITSGGQPPYNYDWIQNQTHKDSSQNLTGISRNYYSVNVTDANALSKRYIYNVGYKTKWTDLNGIISRNDSMFTGGGPPVNDPSARSQNILARNTDGWVELVLPHDADLFFLGFTDNTSVDATGSGSDVEFGVYSSYGNLYAYVNQSYIHLDYLRNGDVIRLQRAGAAYYIALNDNYLYSTATNDNKSIKLKLFLGAPMVNIGCSFIDSTSSQPLTLNPVIDHIQADGIDSKGSISLNPSGGSSPYLVNLETMDENNDSGNLKSLGKGLYKIDIKDNNSDTLEKQYNIGYKVKWTGFNGTAARRDSLVIIESDPPIDNTICKSENFLRKNETGWAEIIAGIYTESYLIGLVDTTNSKDDYHNIEFGFYFGDKKSLYAWDKGDLYNLGAVEPGSVIKLEKNENTVVIKKDGEELYSMGMDDENVVYRLKAYIEGNIPLKNFGCSFQPAFNASILKVQADYTHPYNGAVSIFPYGSKGPYTVRWPDSLVMGSRSDLTPGPYIVTISDSLQTDSIYRTIDIGTKPSWKFAKNSSFSGDTILRIQQDSLGVCVAENIIDANGQGTFEIKVTKTDQDIAFGFIASESNFTEIDARTAFFYNEADIASNTISKFNENTLDYTDGILHLDKGHTSILSIKNGKIAVLIKGSPITARFDYETGDVIKLARNEDQKLTVIKNDKVLYEHVTEINAYLYPLFATNSNAVAANPAVFTTPVSTPLMLPSIYAKPTRKLDGGFYTAISGKVFFTIEGEYSFTTLRFKVYDKTNAIVLANGIGNPISYAMQYIGDNRHYLNVSTLPNGFYTLEISNEKNERQFLRFKQYISTGGGTGTSTQN